jgi:ABC-type multidrug transport system ATPase subunit
MTSYKSHPPGDAATSVGPGDGAAANNYSTTSGGGMAGSFATSPEARHDVQLCFDGVNVIRGKRTLLDHASGIVRGGRLTALVSSCGGRGDYHLLNVLSAQHDGGGLVLAKGSLAHSDEYRQHCALIDEEMTVLDRLTVRENLLYGSEMRANAALDDHHARLKVVVGWLELHDHLGRLVHACSQDVRRRVSIARELMLHPAAVFVDSAIEGLATLEARRLLSCLRRVAAQTGCIVCVSMLQPRWALLELADDAIVLEGASVAFSGPPRELFRIAAASICRINSATPANNENNNNNGVASPTSPVPPLSGHQHQSLADAPEATMNALYRIASNPHTALHASVPALATVQEAVQRDVADVVVRFTEGALPLLVAPFERQPPRMPWKFCLLLKYGVLQVRNRLGVHLLSAVMILLAAVLVGLVYQNQGQSGQAGMQNRVGIIFFLVSSTFLHNLLFIDATKKAFLSFQRHRVHGYYDCVTYLLYWLTVNAVQRLVGCIAFMAVVYALAKVHGTFDLTSLQSLVGVMALVSFASAVLVWLVCGVVPHARYAHFVLFGIYALNTVLAGIVLNLRSLPEAIQSLSMGSLIRLGYESAVASEFRGQTFGCVDAGAHDHDVTATPSQPTTTTMTGPAVWGLGANTTTAAASMAPPNPPSGACFTGRDYMAFLGFSESRQEGNLTLIAYITLAMAAGALLAMWLGKAR